MSYTLNSTRASRATRSLVAALVVSTTLGPVPLSAAAQGRTSLPPASSGVIPATPRAAAPVKITVNRTPPSKSRVPLQPNFSGRATVGEITTARIFAEPLVPVGSSPTAAENQDLAHVLQIYFHGSNRESLAPFIGFLQRNPHSAWKPSLLLNLGTIASQTGYFSRALDFWNEAWELAKSEKDAKSKAVADLAIAHWLELSVKFGRVESAKAMVSGLEGRDIGGQAGSRLAMAQEGLWVLQTHHHLAMASGPMALDSLLRARFTDRYSPSAVIDAVHPVDNGMSLVALRDLAAQAGMTLRAVHRMPEVDPTAPAILHLRSGHFTTLSEVRGDRYLLTDPILGGRLWVSRQALDDEGSGYALVPSDVDASRLRQVSDAEGAVIIGHCAPGAPDSNDPGPGDNGNSNDDDTPPGGPRPSDNPPNTPDNPAPGDSDSPDAGPPPDPDVNTPVDNDVSDSDGDGDPDGGLGPTTPEGQCGLARHYFHPVQASLRFEDSPVGYRPARGPAARFRLYYNHSDQFLPQLPSFWNMGPKWTSNWLSFVTEVPVFCPLLAGCTPEHVAVYLRGGGAEIYQSPDAQGVYPSSWRTRATLVRVSANPIRYERRLRDGRVEVFEQSDGAPAGQRRVFLTQIIDRRGQALTLSYDAQVRLAGVTDAVGQVTTFSYDWPDDERRLTKVTDPFGRSATLAYTQTGQLSTITDVAGMTSRFAYGAADFVTSLTTPYGTTTYQKNATNSYPRTIQATASDGGVQRLEFHFQNPAFAAQENSATVPTGFTASNEHLDYYNTVYWDKRASAVAPGDYSKATLTHWLLAYPGLGNYSFSSSIPHSVKRPLLGRVWYGYPGQSQLRSVGSWVKPTKVARVLDDGTSQVWMRSYNPQGMLVSKTDPVGRETRYGYAANGIDMLNSRQVAANGEEPLVVYEQYTLHHRPQRIVDAAGQATDLTYNAAGQLTSFSSPTGGTTTLSYRTDGSGLLASIQGPVAGAVVAYDYDAYNRLRSTTRPSGYVTEYTYDALNRTTEVAYPDETTNKIEYNRLDVSAREDRSGRKAYFYRDAERRLVAVRDTNGYVNQIRWCACGGAEEVLDSKLQATRWERDILGRTTKELRGATSVAATISYETTTGRVKTRTDAKGQTATFTYSRDNKIAGVAFTGAQIATPAQSYTFDPFYSRLASVTDGSGTTAFTYHSPLINGAGSVASMDGPFANDTLSYGYDQLGRVVSRTASGVAISAEFDTLSRPTKHSTELGDFVYSYSGPDGPINTVTYPNGQNASYEYGPVNNDRRLNAIDHRIGSASVRRDDLTYTPSGDIHTINRVTSGSGQALWTYSHDKGGQLTRAVKSASGGVVVARYGYGYDAAGNRIMNQKDDAVTTWLYDATNRLTGQAPGGQLRVAGLLNEAGSVTINGVKANVAADNGFVGQVAAQAGTTQVNVAAVDTSGNVRSQNYEVAQTGTPRSFTYDANGNVMSDGMATYEWDARNRLVAVNGPTGRRELSYDAFSRPYRVVDTPTGQASTGRVFIWCGYRMCQERDTSGGSVAARQYPLGFVGSSGSRFYALDHLGRRVLTTDGTGTAKGKVDFDPFGAFEQSGVEPIEFITPSQFATADGRHMMGPFRTYTPAEGRWLSEDPIGFAGDGLNLYGYVANSPMRYVDPLGLRLFYIVTAAADLAGEFIAATGGVTFVIDPESGVVTRMVYVGGGGGLGVTPITAAGSIQVGIANLDDPSDLLGWGAQFGGEAALGFSGLAGSVGFPMPWDGDVLGTAGWAFGIAGGVSGVLTYTFEGGETTKFQDLPKEIRDAVNKALAQISCKK